MIQFYKEWKKFRENDDRESRDFLVIQYLPLAKYIASRTPSSTHALYSYDDILSWACIGLIDAIGKFDHEKGVKFETYAISRIRGEISDNLMELTSSYYSRKKAIIDQNYEKLYSRFDRPPDDYEMAEELGMEVDKYRNMLSNISPVYIISFDELIDIEGYFPAVREKIAAKEDFTSILDIKEKKEALARAIHSLPKKERQIIILYDYEGLTMKEIAGILNLSEGRISQLHTCALIKLKKELKKSEKIQDK
ncbi:MAG: sigma-70 family RNA polymerase sigma factor [Proteobacteria bacterium]|nr:sigma-70 family RNA polymerase sigma factor [Pseudomonadota bacterium]